MAIAALKGDKTLAELAEHYDVHQNQISDWKKQLLEHADSVFSNAHDQRSAGDAECKELHAKIGQLTQENDFLTKALGK